MIHGICEYNNSLLFLPANITKSHTHLHFLFAYSNWGERYACKKAQEYGCTPDNRMSAACYLIEYGKKAMGLKNAAPFYPCNPKNGGKVCTSRNDQGLPEDYRYFEYVHTHASND